MKKCPSCLRTRTVFVDGVCQSCFNRFLKVAAYKMEQKTTDRLIKFLLKETNRLRDRVTALEELLIYSNSENLRHGR